MLQDRGHACSGVCLFLPTILLYMYILLDSWIIFQLFGNGKKMFEELNDDIRRAGTEFLFCCQCQVFRQKPSLKQKKTV